MRLDKEYIDGRYIFFTGLVLKNGQKVYEGDLVKAFRANTYIDKKDAVYQVLWNEKLFAFGLWNPKKYSYGNEQGGFMGGTTTAMYNINAITEVVWSTPAQK